MKKILTLDDLVRVCKEQKLKKFSSKEVGYKLRVQIPAKFEMDENESSSTLFAHVEVMHTGRNRNGSNLTEKAAKNCLDTIPYKPILANFCEIDGVRDFTSHDFTINEDGEVEYQERQVGCFTADKPYMKEDEEVEGRKNIYAKVAIPREYTDAAEIIERKNGTKVSAELEINSMSYDVKEKELLLEDVELIGLTLLGKNPETGEDVQEGMQGAHIQLEDFSADKNSLNFDISDEIKQFIQVSIMEALSDKNKRGKEDTQMEFEEKTEVTETEQVEETVTEEFTEAENSDEVFEETATEESTEEEVTVTEAESEDDTEVTPAEEEIFEDAAEETEAEEEASGEEESENEEFEANNLKMSVSINGEVKTFEVSLAQKINALYELVNSTYSDSDNDYYDVDVFDDSKIVIMHGWFSGKHFKQSYSLRKDVYSLKGDRVEVFATYLTADEQAQLDSMKQSYAEVSEKLSKYEAEPEKVMILESEDYKNLSGNEAFEALKVQENHFDLSVEEVKTQCDAMLLEYAKGHKVEFSVQEDNEKKPVGRKPFSIVSKKRNYGSLLNV